MNILVTGGAGFIGRPLVAALRAAGHDVAGIDDFSRSKAVNGVDMCDVRDVGFRDFLRPEFEVDTVVHMAAINGTEHFYRRPGEVLDVGIRGTLNVVDAAKAAGVSTFVYFSSSEVYGQPDEIPTSETAPFRLPQLDNPRYSYAASKIAGEYLVRYAGFERYVILRPFNVYGPDMGREHVVPQLVEKILSADESFEITGDGQQVRCFCHVSDFVEGALLAIEDGDGVYNIGDPTPITISTLQWMIRRRLGREHVRCETGPGREGDPVMRVPDVSRIESLGYAPQVSLARGLDESVVWYAENRP